MVHESYVKVRFCETDALGHVNNISYFIYLEEARINFFRDIGFQADPKKWNFILASTKCDFVKQAYFNQKLCILTSVSHIGTKSVRLSSRVVDEETNQLIANGEAVVVYFDFQKQQSAAIPPQLKEELTKYMAT